MQNYQMTKEQLEYFYLTGNKSLDEIAQIYGFKSRTPIRNKFKQFGIEIRTKGDATKLRASIKTEETRIPKECLEKDLIELSILKIAKKYKLPKGRIYGFMEEYGLSNNYYKNLHLKEELVKQENLDLTPKQLAIKYDTTVGIIKSYKKNFITRIYSNDEIKEKIIEYGYDLSNQGLVKQIQYDDLNLYSSITEKTKNHKLFGDKFTERLYRLIHDIQENKEFICTNCNVNKLKFYTYEMGYGNSDYQLCECCNNVLNGVSKISQEMFWGIFSLVDNKLECNFHDLNNEKVIYINDDFKNMYDKSNKRYYQLDFVYKNKVIEFDGRYYHKDTERDDVKDIFLQSKGFSILHITDQEYLTNKSETIQKCIDFLNQ